jgi:hypothetical protein
MTKKNGRPGRNPRIQEVQLKGMLQALNVTAEQLEKTNKVLSTEASAVLEALWNGHQALVAQVGEMQCRLDQLLGENADEEMRQELLAEENAEIIRDLDNEEMRQELLAEENAEIIRGIEAEEELGATVV